MAKKAKKSIKKSKKKTSKKVSSVKKDKKIEEDLKEVEKTADILADVAKDLNKNEEKAKDDSDFDSWFNTEGMKMIRHGHSIRSIVMRCLRDSGKGASFREAHKSIGGKNFNRMSVAGNIHNPEPIENMCKLAWDCSPPDKK